MIIPILLICVCVYFIWNDLTEASKAHSKGAHGIAAMWLMAALFFVAMTVFHGRSLYYEIHPEQAETCQAPPAEKASE